MFLRRNTSLLVIEIFIILFTIPTFYSYNGKINVRGKLIDINGNPISDAQVKIYRNDVLIFQTETGNEGTFSFYVEREVVLVRFQAHGYEVKEIKLDLSSKTALTYWMGEIILDYSIKIVPGGNIFRTEQGEFLQIPVLIMNDGYEKETCLVEIKTPTDWRAQFVSSNGLRIEGFSIIPGARETFNLKVQVPRNALGSYNITLIIRGFFVHKAPIEVIVEKKDWKLIEAEFIDATALRDSQVIFNFKIVNNLGERAVLELSVDAPQNWRTDIRDNSNRSFTTVFLEPDESVSAFIKVRIPPDAKYGKEIITLRACGLGVCSTIDFTIHVVEGYDDIQLFSTHPFTSAYAGSMANIKVKVRNEGLSGTIVSFDVKDLPETYTFTIRDKKGNIVNQLFLESGSEEELEINILIPTGTEPGFVQFTLTAKGETSEAKINLGINILGRYELKVLTENFYLETTAGSKQKFYVDVKNSGHTVISNLRIIITDTPQKIKVNVEPKDIPLLMPGETGRFTLVVNVEPEIPSGDYFVEFKIESASATIARSLRVNVKPREEIAYLSLITVVFIIVALAFLYRRYGRR